MQKANFLIQTGKNFSFLINLILLIYFYYIGNGNFKGIGENYVPKIDSIARKYKGKEFDSINIRSLSYDIIDFFEDKGFPFAKIKFISFLKRNDTIDYFVEIDKGKICFLEGIDFDGVKRINKDELKRIFRFKRCIFSKKILRNFKNKLYFFDFIFYENYYFYETQNKIFLGIVLRENLNNLIEAGIGYSNEIKEFLGNINLHFDALFGSLRSFDLLWKRIKKGNNDFLISYEEPFFYFFDMKIKGNYSLYQRDTIYTRENFDIISYLLLPPFKIGFGGSYEENRDFIIKENIFRVLNIFEIEGGKKEYFNSGFYIFSNSKYSKNNYFRIQNVFEGRKIYKKIGILNRIFYFKVFKKNPLISSEYFYIGGKDNLRGYDEEEFKLKEGIVLNIENYYVFSKNFSPLLFFDSGIFKKDFIKKSFGFGIIGEGKNFSYKILFGFPYKESIYNAKVHFTIKNYF